MTAKLPTGYITFHEAAEAIERALFAGERDKPHMSEVRRRLGHDVGDGAAAKAASEELWKAVDAGHVHVFALQLVRLDPDITRRIPLVRKNPNLAYVRPSHPDWQYWVATFSANCNRAILAFDEDEVKRFALKLMRRRRRKRERPSTSKAGRRSSRQHVAQAIEKIVEKNAWTAKQSVKTLTTLVNRSSLLAKPVSSKTVTRALRELHRDTHDRRFERGPTRRHSA
jgi:hypothetical protein